MSMRIDHIFVFSSHFVSRNELIVAVYHYVWSCATLCFTCIDRFRVMIETVFIFDTSRVTMITLRTTLRPILQQPVLVSLIREK